jgi:hypothetical protein
MTGDDEICRCRPAGGERRTLCDSCLAARQQAVADRLRFLDGEKPWPPERRWEMAGR